MLPLIVFGAMAIYFEKKSGMTTPDENVQAEQRGQVMKQNGVSGT